VSMPAPAPATAAAHDAHAEPATLPVTPVIYDTVVSHVRSAPLRNTFTYRSYSWLVDLDALPALPWYARPLARFDARDHFAGTAVSIRAGLDAVLAAEGVEDVARVVMLASPRVLGYTFNPLSVHWCHRADGSLACVVAEVHNTYGERHAYVVRTDTAGRADVDKAFYVSPFYEVAGRYTMSLPEPGATLTQVVTLHREGELPFVASVRGTAHSATVAGLLRSVARCPGASIGVAIKIRWQGIRLYLRRLPVVTRPPLDHQEGVTR
jgi:DUF1365 family protein